MTKDLLWLHLKELPYFRALLRSIEASFYTNQDLPRPILDVGCGDGHFTQVAFDTPIDIGVDPDGRIMREAQSRAVYHLLIQSDAGRLPLPSASIGSAFSNSVLEHIPHLEKVLAEVGRVLKPGAPFIFTVPNPGYRSELSVPRLLGRLGLPNIGNAYTAWFMRMSRTIHMEYEEGWAQRLGKAGMRIERSFHYFSPAALRILEWGHYFGAPCLLPRKLFGRWIVAPYKWNLALTRMCIQRYHDASPRTDGTYSYYRALRE